MKIPSALKRHADKIAAIDVDADGWKFVYLKYGWIYDGVHTVAYATYEECAKAFSMVEPCDCADCRHELAKAGAA